MTFILQDKHKKVNRKDAVKWRQAACFIFPGYYVILNMITIYQHQEEKT